MEPDGPGGGPYPGPMPGPSAKLGRTISCMPPGPLVTLETGSRVALPGNSLVCEGPALFCGDSRDGGRRPRKVVGWGEARSSDGASGDSVCWLVVSVGHQVDIARFCQGGDERPPN